MVGHMTVESITSNCQNCVYYRQLLDNLFVYLLLRVDDMLIAAKSMLEIKRLKSQLVEIHKDRKTGKLYLSQKKVH
jgi:hypothetical protein